MRPVAPQQSRLNFPSAPVPAPASAQAPSNAPAIAAITAQIQAYGTADRGFGLSVQWLIVFAVRARSQQQKCDALSMALMEKVTNCVVVQPDEQMAVHAAKARLVDLQKELNALQAADPSRRALPPPISAVHPGVRSGPCGTAPPRPATLPPPSYQAPSYTPLPSSSPSPLLPSSSLYPSATPAPAPVPGSYARPPYAAATTPTYEPSYGTTTATAARSYDSTPSYAGAGGPTRQYSSNSYYSEPCESC